MAAKSIVVQTPASTSNCGPGFDSLGIALKLYNYVRVEMTESEGVTYLGEETMSEASMRMVAEAADLFYSETGRVRHGVGFDIWGQIPIARGLGSSSTLRAGIVEGLNALNGNSLDKEDLAALVCQLDHSPDNTCPLVHGGFCVARTDPDSGAHIYTLKHAVSDSIRFVVVSPETRVLTGDARKVLPEKISFEDAVKSINSAATVVSIFASQQYDLLGHAITDYIHQPYRGVLNPFLSEVIGAGQDAGAYTGWLSGSGSSILCVAPAEDALEVANRMTGVLTAAGVQSQFFVLEADNNGVQIVSDSDSSVE